MVVLPAGPALVSLDDNDASGGNAAWRNKLKYYGAKCSVLNISGKHLNNTSSPALLTLPVLVLLGCTRWRGAPSPSWASSVPAASGCGRRCPPAPAPSGCHHHRRGGCTCRRHSRHLGLHVLLQLPGSFHLVQPLQNEVHAGDQQLLDLGGGKQHVHLGLVGDLDARLGLQA